MSPVRAFLALSGRLKTYLLVWYGLGLLTVAYALCSLARHQWIEILPYVGLSLALNFKTVRGSSDSSTGSASVSLSSVAAFAAIVGVHPLAGVPVEVFGTLLDSLFPKRRPAYQALFNISVCSVGTLAAGLIYQALGGPRFTFGPNPDAVTPALLAMMGAAWPMLLASFSYFLVNTVSVAQVVSLASGANMEEFWKRSFQSSFVGYLAGGACVVLVFGLSTFMPWLSLLLLTGPILYAAYSREQSDEARVQALEKGKERLEGMYIASIRTLALTVAARDRYTSGHIHRVTAYALAIARFLGLSDEEMTDLQTGALLHDIGKIGVPEYILIKPGKLTPEEMDTMRRHAEIGWAILQPLNFPESVKQIVRNHHEWYNGAGYPDGLSGEEIPLLVRIVGVADVFDALTSDRPYRAALSVEESRDIMRRNLGSQFDPLVVRAFFEILDTVPWEELQAVPSESPMLTEILERLPGPVVTSSMRITPMRDPTPIPYLLRKD